MSEPTKRRTFKHKFTVQGMGWEEFKIQADRYGRVKGGPDFSSGPAGFLKGPPVLGHTVNGQPINFTRTAETLDALTITAEYADPALAAYYKGLVKWLGEKRETRPSGGRPRLEPNAWLIEQHFDKGRPLRDLQAEWLQRREKAGLNPLVDAPGNMRGIIRRERRERARRG